MVERDGFADAQVAAREACDQGAEMIEWRFDLVAKELSSCSALVSESPLPCIVTCRPVWEGGEFEGSEEDRIEFLREMIHGGEARYIDIEMDAHGEGVRELRCLIAGDTRDRAAGLILSTHDFTGRPSDLYRRIGRMSEADAAVNKVVWQAKSLRDNLQVFEILRRKVRPTIGLCMGRFGLMSRILAPKFGGFLTFAKVEGCGGTAAGQPSVMELRNRYRFDAIGRDTKVYGLMGYPVEHSLGMGLHNAGFSRVGFDGVYVPMPIPPEYEHFKATLSAFLDDDYLDFRGASVTLPHKEHLVRFIEEWDGAVEVGEWVEVSGSANTIVVDENGLLKIDNTDIDGLLDSLCEKMKIGREGLSGMRVAVIGAGGVARSAVAGLSGWGAEVCVFNRTSERGEKLADDFNGRKIRGGRLCDVSSYSLEEFGFEPYDILIHATSVGMHGGSDEDGCPVSVDSLEKGMKRDGLVYDLVYTPIETPLLRHVKACGFQVLGGLDMLVRQAVRQFAMWTGVEGDIEEWRKVAREGLKE